MDKGLWTASCFLIILGILFLGTGSGFQFYLNSREVLRGRVTARVVELLLREPEKKDLKYPYKNCYYPVLEYYAEGRLYKAVHPEGAYPSPFHLNQEVRIKYNKEDPQEYEILEKNPLRLGAYVLYALGVLCIAAGCIIFVILALRG